MAVTANGSFNHQSRNKDQKDATQVLMYPTNIYLDEPTCLYFVWYMMIQYETKPREIYSLQ